MEILPENKLKSHTEHIFNIELKNSGQCTHLRLNIFPDGGVSRLRILAAL
jgi:allantoicase